MINDPIDFNNSMRTLGWSVGAVGGFEELAYGAALTLIHYQGMTSAGRLAWAKANALQSREGQSGVMKTKQGAFLAYLNQLRLGTFGIAFDDHSVSHQTSLLSNPWALTDPQFQYCMFYIKTGRLPDDEKFKDQIFSKNGQIVASHIEETLQKQALKYLEKGAVTVGGAAIETLFKIKNATVVGLASDIALDVLQKKLEEREKKDTTARYQLDEARRVHLASKGASTYQNIALRL
jgi:hypothetical protein